MPDWCKNTLVVLGEPKELAEFVAAACGNSCPWPDGDSDLEVLSLHSLVPVPKDILEQPYDPEGLKWEIGNWGVQWGAEESQLLAWGDGMLVYGFNTLWDPPVAWLMQVSNDYPTLSFRLTFDKLDGLNQEHGSVDILLGRVISSQNF